MGGVGWVVSSAVIEHQDHILAKGSNRSVLVRVESFLQCPEVDRLCDNEAIVWYFLVANWLPERPGGGVLLHQL